MFGRGQQSAYGHQTGQSAFQQQFGGTYSSPYASNSGLTSLFANPYAQMAGLQHTFNPYGSSSYSGLSDADAARDARLMETKLRSLEAREASLIEKLKDAEAELASRSPSGSHRIAILRRSAQYLVLNLLYHCQARMRLCPFLCTTRCWKFPRLVEFKLNDCMSCLSLFYCAGTHPLHRRLILLNENLVAFSVSVI
jgi:hypothetical protein